MTTLKQALLLHPENHGLWFELGEMSLAENDITSAILCLEQSLSKATTGIEFRRSYSFLRNATLDLGLKTNSVSGSDAQRTLYANICGRGEKKGVDMSLSTLNDVKIELDSDMQLKDPSTFNLFTLEVIKSLQRKGKNYDGLCTSFCSLSSEGESLLEGIGDSLLKAKHAPRASHIPAIGEDTATGTEESVKIDTAPLQAGRKRRSSGDEGTSETVRFSKRHQKKAILSNETDSVFDIDLKSFLDEILPRDYPITHREISKGSKEQPKRSLKTSPMEFSESHRQFILTILLEMENLTVFDINYSYEEGYNLNVILSVSEFLFGCMAHMEDETEKIGKVFNNWWSLFNKLSIAQQSYAQLSFDLLLRKLFLQGRVLELAQPEAALLSYHLCLQVIHTLEEGSFMKPGTRNSFSLINESIINDRITVIDCKRYITETIESFESGDYQGVLSSLWPLFFRNKELHLTEENSGLGVHFFRIGRKYICEEASPSERHRVLDVLVDVATRCGSRYELFSCIAKTITVLTQDFFYFPLSVAMKKISNVLFKLIVFLMDNEESNILYLSSQGGGWDFLDKTNNLDVVEIAEKFQRLSNVSHGLLGDISACTEDDGIFLKIILRYLSKLPGGESSSEVYQCYCCLYGLIIRIDGESPHETHDVQRVQFDKNAARGVFAVILRHVNQKLSRGYKTVSMDLRDCVDRISEFFKEPPWEQKLVAYNKEVIDIYLQSDITFNYVYPYLKSKAAYVEKPLASGEDEIFNLRAKISLSAHKQKSSVIRTWKMFEMLEGVVRDLKFNLYLNCSKMDSWFQLGQVFGALSNEYLSWSASEIMSSFSKIRNYQKNAYHCFAQVFIILSESLASGHDIKHDFAGAFWSAFGQLCYSIIMKPMLAAALKETKPNSLALWNKRYRDLSGDEYGDGCDKKLVLLKIAHMCFLQAMKVERANWQYPYMLAKIKEKLDRNNYKGIARLYKRAIALAPVNWTTKEQEIILDPRYGLISYLSKQLFSGRIQAKDVQDVFKNIRSVDATQSKEPVNEDSCTSLSVDSTASTESIFQLLVGELQSIKAVDKKRWHHKPYWRVLSLPIQRLIFSTLGYSGSILKIHKLQRQSFFHFFILNQRQNHLLTSGARNLNDRPGKHFVYVHKYACALIDLLSETSDLENIVVLLKKIKRPDDVLLYPLEIWKKAIQAFRDIVTHRADITQYWSNFSKGMTIAELQMISKEIEKRFTSGSAPETETTMLLLHLIAVKKLYDEDEDNNWLDEMIAGCYAKICIQTMPETFKSEERENVDSALVLAVGKKALALSKMKTAKSKFGNDDQEPSNASVCSQSQDVDVSDAIISI
ncbi:Histone transcription regulator 3 [Dinochytrium kinnereticum]|nr:Histone transcription regulator 3 [Dinochytrium kinnereticum]